jgi:hypothetical protein
MGERLDEQIGHTQVDLDGRFTSVRTRETNLGNLVADVFRKAANADVALLNSGTLRWGGPRNGTVEQKRHPQYGCMTIWPCADTPMHWSTGAPLHAACSHPTCLSWSIMAGLTTH